MADFDATALAFKMACPSNTLLTDDRGLPGAYVQRPRKTLADLIAGGDSSVHPAFLVHSKEVSKLLIGKFQGKAHGSRIYSLPGEDPTANITLDTYETYCKNKGDGHHCITAAEWAYLALLAKKNGTQPKGNNDYGKDHSETQRIAIPTYMDGAKIGRVATGTGPLTWSDTGDLTGIFDLNGNVWEWVAGIRLVKGELQVIPYNDAAAPDVDTSPTSNRWKAINAQATGYSDLFVAPNGQGTTAGTVKLEWVTNHWQWQSGAITSGLTTYKSAAFALTTYSGLSVFCKMYLQAMALGPEDGAAADDYNGDVFWANNFEAERRAFRGGSWSDGAGSGVFALDFYDPRSDSNFNVGGRPAFYE